MRKGEWSTEDVSRLIEIYPTHTNAELADIFNRSQSAINTKAYKLELQKSAETLSRAISTRYDSQIAELNKLPIDEVPINIAFKHSEWLEFNYYEKEFSMTDIAEITGSTRKNIEYWMNKFGLPRRDDQGRYTDRCLQKISETGKGRVPFSKGLTKYDHPAIMKISEKVKGQNSYRWNGGSTVNNRGYRLVSEPNHPKADKDGYVLEHRLVMEFMLGRLLKSEEVVHHRDCNRKNNVTSNLFLFPNSSAHTSFHNYKRLHDANISEENFMAEVCKYAK